MMRFPEKNSRGEQVLLAFFARGAMTIWQGAEAHGDFAQRNQTEELTHNKLLQLYCELVDRECLVREGIKYRLSLHAQHLLEKRHKQPEPPAGIVPPRIRNMFSKPLFVGYTPNFPWRLAL